MGKKGCVVLRRAMARGPEARAELTQAAELGLTVEGTVMPSTRAESRYRRRRAGLLPHLAARYRHVPDAAEYSDTNTNSVSRAMSDRRGANLVLSRRALLEEEARGRAEKIDPSWSWARSFPAWSRPLRTSVPSWISAASKECCTSPSLAIRAHPPRGSSGGRATAGCADPPHRKDRGSETARENFAFAQVHGARSLGRRAHAISGGNPGRW